MRKYDRVFVCNPSFKFDVNELSNLANEVIYVCDRPMFDNLAGDDNIYRFEGRIAEKMADFDPEKDIIAYYGDSMIFAIMVMWVVDTFSEFDIARYSAKKSSYVIRRVSYDNFFIEPPAQEQE
jgi:hypothetical protein